MTASELASRAGLDKGNLSRILNGRVSPTLETTEAIVQACGLMLIAASQRDLRDLAEARARRDAGGELSGLERSLKSRRDRPS